MPAPGVDVFVFAGPDAVGRHAALQPLLRRRRPAAEVGPGLHDAHADGATPPRRCWTRSTHSASAASRSTCSGSSPAGTTTPTRARSSGTRRDFPTRRASSSTSSSGTSARTSGSTRTSRRRRRSTRSFCRSPERTSSGTASFPTSPCPAARQIFADHLRANVAAIEPRRDRRVQGGRGRRLRPLALARHCEVPLRPRRRAAPPDLRPARAAHADGHLRSLNRARWARFAARTAAPRRSRS